MTALETAGSHRGQTVRITRLRRTYRAATAAAVTAYIVLSNIYIWRTDPGLPSGWKLAVGIAFAAVVYGLSITFVWYWALWASRGKHRVREQDPA